MSQIQQSDISKHRQQPISIFERVKRQDGGEHPLEKEREKASWSESSAQLLPATPAVHAG